MTHILVSPPHSTKYINNGMGDNYVVQNYAKQNQRR